MKTVNYKGLPIIGSDQKLIFDHDQLICFQKSIFQSDHRYLILYGRSFHFPMIDFSIFFNNKKMTDFMALRDPRDAYGTLNAVKSVYFHCQS